MGEEDHLTDWQGRMPDAADLLGGVGRKKAPLRQPADLDLLHRRRSRVYMMATCEAACILHVAPVTTQNLRISNGLDETVIKGITGMA